jgi:hypothetical protein
MHGPCTGASSQQPAASQQFVTLKSSSQWKRIQLPGSRQAPIIAVRTIENKFSLDSLNQHLQSAFALAKNKGKDSKKATVALAFQFAHVIYLIQNW